MDLEADIRSCPEILAKVINRNDYAQNLYAAMCNMRWIPADAITILKEDFWHCSWRAAGGIVANLQQKGDYMDWYCSGMGGLSGYDQDSETFEQWQVRTKYVSEGTVTEEIREDFKKIGWIPSEWPDDTKDG